MGLRHCKECGEPLPDDAPKRKRFCQKCIAKHHREEESEMVRYYKSRGICPRCRARYAAEGRVHCESCLEIFRGYNKRRKGVENDGADM